MSDDVILAQPSHVRFEPVCSAITESAAPTTNPSAPTTIPPPSGSPTVLPSAPPSTSFPTPADAPFYNVSFAGDAVPSSQNAFMTDPYGRFEAAMSVRVDDEEGVLGIIELCASCFVWQFQSADEDVEWTDIAFADDDDISVSISRTGDMYTSRLTVQSTRRLHAGRCVDEADDDRLFLPSQAYNVRMRFVVKKDEYHVALTSQAFSFWTNSLPANGLCIVQNVEALLPLQPYNLFCAGWDVDEGELEFNALMDNVAMSAGYVDDARKLTSVAPVGNVSIVVLVKRKEQFNAITCYDIDVEFKSVTESIQLDNSSNQTLQSAVDAILTSVGAITNSTSFSEDPSVAVSIHTVIDDIYTANLTTQAEAAMVIDDPWATRASSTSSSQWATTRATFRGSCSTATPS